MEPKQLQLREAFSAGINLDTRVDFAAGIVHDVVLLGKTSLNKKRYIDKAIDDAFKVVEASGSYIDHPTGENNNRSIKERFGVFKGPYKNGAGELCAREFVYDKKNSFAPSFEWMLKHCPKDIGFSINADAMGYQEGEEIVVTEITKCHGFDLVDRPATTGGIFNVRESVNRRSITIREALNSMFPEAFKTGLSELAAAITAETIDLKGAQQKLKTLFALVAPDEAKVVAEVEKDIAAEESYNSAPETEKPMKAMESASKSRFGFVRYLANQLDAYRVREAQEKEIKAREQAVIARVQKAEIAFGVNKGTLITATFREQLAAAKDEKEVDSLITDRLSVFNVREQVTKTETPISAPAGSGGDNIAAEVARLFGDLNN